MMNNRSQLLDDFFAEYENRFNKALAGDSPDIESIIQSFSSCFIEASPVGIICGNNDETFRKEIPEGYAFYKKIGITGMYILSKEHTILDEYHAMTRVHWKSEFIKDNSSGSIEFDVIYFTQWLNDVPKIFAYITGDEQKALKKYGLI